MLRISRPTSRAASMLVRRSSASSNENRATERPTPRSPASSMARARSRPNASSAEQAGARVDHALGFDRLEQALEPVLEGALAHHRDQPLDQPVRVAGVHQVGQFVDALFGAEHGDRQIAEAAHPRPSTTSRATTIFGDRPSPITMPSMSRTLRQRAARSTLIAPITPMRSPTATLSVGCMRPRPTTRTVASSIGSPGGNLGDDVALGQQRAGAADHRRVQRAQPQRGRQPCDQPLRHRRLPRRAARWRSGVASSSRVRATTGM